MIHVFRNPTAGNDRSNRDLRSYLQQAFGDHVGIIETGGREDAIEKVRESAGDCDMVVAAGGDGTINAVLHGLMEFQARSNSGLPTLGVIPCGTANNLCRTLGVPLDPVAAIDCLVAERTSRLDLCQVDCGGERGYYATVASGGNSERVMEQLDPEEKKRWGPWCYLRSALPILADLTGYDATVQFDDEPPQRCSLWNVMVAGGRHAASGMQVAPRAALDDGLLDVIVIPDGTPMDLASLTAEFLLGDYLEDERVVYRQVRRLRIETTTDLTFFADGEKKAGAPYEFSVVPGALRVVVGEESRGLGWLGAEKEVSVR